MNRSLSLTIYWMDRQINQFDKDSLSGRNIGAVLHFTWRLVWLLLFGQLASSHDCLCLHYSDTSKMVLKWKKKQTTFSNWKSPLKHLSLCTGHRLLLIAWLSEFLLQNFSFAYVMCRYFLREKASLFCFSLLFSNFHKRQSACWS